MSVGGVWQGLEGRKGLVFVLKGPEETVPDDEETPEVLMHTPVMMHAVVRWRHQDILKDKG
jgi:hypothetical protein